MNYKMNQNKKFIKQNITDTYLYSKSLITRSVKLNITSIGKNINETLLQKLRDECEGRCVVEGYIKPKSCLIKSYSSGLLKSSYVMYEVMFECLTCFPVEGMLINCTAINITKAGIRAEITTVEKPSPAIVFITRDHNYNIDEFSQIKEGDVFVARVIGQRFELNDKFVSVIAKLKTKTKEHLHKIVPNIINTKKKTSVSPKKTYVLDKLVSVIPSKPITLEIVEKENIDEDEEEKKDEEENEEEENEEEEDEEDEQEDEEDEPEEDEEGKKTSKLKKDEED